LRIDLTIDQEGGNARLLRLLHDGDRGIAARVVKENGCGLVGDGGVEQFVLLVRFVVVRMGLCGNSQFLGARFGARGLSGKEAVVVVRGDEHDQLPIGESTERK